MRKGGYTPFIARDGMKRHDRHSPAVLFFCKKFVGASAFRIYRDLSFFPYLTQKYTLRHKILSELF